MLCIRLRSCDNKDYDIQNCDDEHIDKEKVKNNCLSKLFF